jgi:hypothetical protein
MVAPGPALSDEHDKLLGLVEGARIEILRNAKGSPTGVRVASNLPAVPISIKVTDLVAKQYPKMPGIYSLTSGIMHGMPHMLEDNSQIAGRHARWDADPLQVGASVLAAANVGYTVLATLGWHRGFEHDPAISSAHERIDEVDQAMQRFGREHLASSRRS